MQTIFCITATARKYHILSMSEDSQKKDVLATTSRGTKHDVVYICKTQLSTSTEVNHYMSSEARQWY